MAKEKVSETEIKNKEFIFIYEIIGVILVLFSLISVFRLGFLGKYGMLTFRLLFGDWYFLFIGLMAFLGIYFLFMHQRFLFNSIRYLGVILIVLSLIILSHFSMHNFVIQYESNPFTTTISLYLDYFKNARNDMMGGGGIVGCLLFYLLFFLLSKIGTIIVCIFLIFLGIVFLTKRTIIDFFRLIKRLFSKCFGGAFSLSKKIKEKIKVMNNDYIVETVEVKKIKKKYIAKDSINQDEEYNEAIALESKIKNVLNYLNIFYQDLTFIVCLHITVYFISTLQVVNYDVLKISLNKIIKRNYLIRFDEVNHMIIIEVNNNNVYDLSFNEALKKVKKLDNLLLIGKDDRNEYVLIDSSMLIISNNNYLYHRYLASLIVLPLFYDSVNNYEIIIVDLNQNLKKLSNIVSKYYDMLDDLEDIKKELDEDLKILQNSGYSNINDYNKNKKKELIKNKYIYINGVENIINNFEYNKYLEYFIVSGSNIGYIFVIGCTDKISDNNIIFRSLNYKLFMENNFDLSRKYFNEVILSKMTKNKEGILKYKDLIVRMSLLMIKQEELEKIENLKK